MNNKEFHIIPTHYLVEVYFDSVVDEHWHGPPESRLVATLPVVHAVPQGIVSAMVPSQIPLQQPGFFWPTLL